MNTNKFKINQILNRFTFQELPDGIYELEYKQNDFFIVSAKKEDIDLFDFLDLIDEEHYYLEKRKQLANLFFPDNTALEKYDFLDNKESYRDIITKFKGWVRRSNITYLCNCDEYISGLSSFSKNFSLDVDFELWVSSLTYCTLAELEGAYKESSTTQHINRILKKLTPEVMLNYCQNRIQGQGIQLKKAVYQVYRYIQQVAEDKPFQAENWLLTAPSGSGKTEFFRAIKDLFAEYHLPIPVVQIDLSQITETGFKGSNASTIPARILAEKLDGAGIGICFLDETDKKCCPSYTSQGNNVNAAVQSNLLTLLEGIEDKVEVSDKMYPFDSNKTMFVLMGAFQDIRKQKQEKETKSSLGFFSSLEKQNTSSQASDSFYEDLEIQDLIDFGMQEELAGRLVQIVNFHKLSESDMLALLKHKAVEISKSLRVNLEITESAAEEFLSISFGSLGIRRPMNIMRQLSQNAVAEVFFDGGFDSEQDKVVIDSLHSAHIEKSKKTLLEHEE